MADKLIGQNYTTPDLVAKVTGKAKYAEDFRAEGMLFCKLLLSPMPHARVTRLDTSAALAMPGVKAILTVDDLPRRGRRRELGENVRRERDQTERGLTMEPMYEGEPILAVAAVDELTAAEAIEKIVIEFEPLPFAVDPIASLRPGSAERARHGQRLGASADARRPPPPRRSAAAGARAGAAARLPPRRPAARGTCSRSRRRRRPPAQPRLQPPRPPRLPARPQGRRPQGRGAGRGAAWRAPAVRRVPKSRN